MGIVYLLLPLSILLALVGLGAFLWGQRKDQFEDLETPAVRMLFDEEKKDTKR